MMSHISFYLFILSIIYNASNGETIQRSPYTDSFFQIKLTIVSNRQNARSETNTLNINRLLSPSSPHNLMPRYFGTLVILDKKGPSGDVVHSACRSPFDDNFNMEWIAVITESGDCSTEKKLNNICRLTRASAVIIALDHYRPVVDRPSPAYDVLNQCMAIQVSSRWLSQHFNATHPANATIDVIQDGGVSRTSVFFASVSFVLLMVISMAWLIFYYVQRFRNIHKKERQSRRLVNAAKKALSKIPIKSLRPGDPELDGDNEQCAVCIELYKVADTIRVLPCKHFFHKTCIDPWLLEQRSCPMCKVDILEACGVHLMHSQTDFHSHNALRLTRLSSHAATLEIGSGPASNHSGGIDHWVGYPPARESVGVCRHCSGQQPQQVTYPDAGHRHQNRHHHRNRMGVCPPLDPHHMRPAVSPLDSHHMRPAVSPLVAEVPNDPAIHPVLQDIPRQTRSSGRYSSRYHQRTRRDHYSLQGTPGLFSCPPSLPHMCLHIGSHSPQTSMSAIGCCLFGYTTGTGNRSTGSGGGYCSSNTSSSGEIPAHYYHQLYRGTNQGQHRRAPGGMKMDIGEVCICPRCGVYPISYPYGGISTGLPGDGRGEEEDAGSSSIGEGPGGIRVTVEPPEVQYHQMPLPSGSSGSSSSTNGHGVGLPPYIVHNHLSLDVDGNPLPACPGCRGGMSTGQIPAESGVGHHMGCHQRRVLVQLERRGFDFVSSSSCSGEDGDIEAMGWLGGHNDCSDDRDQESFEERDDSINAQEVFNEQITALLPHNN